MKASVCALFILVLTLFSACDSFSLKTELVTPKDLASPVITDNPPPPPSNLSLTATTTRLTEGQTATLTPSGGVGPYTITASPETMGTVSNTGSWTYTAGAEIGTVRLTLTDNQDTQTHVNIDVVPEAVVATNIIVTRTDRSIQPKNVLDVSWNYENADRLTKFLVAIKFAGVVENTVTINSVQGIVEYEIPQYEVSPSLKNSTASVTITAVAEVDGKTYESEPATAVAPAL